MSAADETKKKVLTLLERSKTLLNRFDEMGKKGHVNDLSLQVGALRDAVNDLEGNKTPGKYKEKARIKKVSDDEYQESHEAFGLLSISRTYGGRGSRRLFGSHLETHHHTISVTVRRAYVSHSLGKDWYHWDSMSPLIEFELSAAQFAEAITSLNQGEGVPCTLRYVEGVAMRDLPENYIQEHTRIKNDFEEQVKDAVAEMEAAHEKAQQILLKKSINKGDRESLAEVLRNGVRMFKDTAPFLVSQFGESAQKVTSAAKQEVEAFITERITSAGLASMEEAKQFARAASGGALPSGEGPEPIPQGPKRNRDRKPARENNNG